MTLDGECMSGTPWGMMDDGELGSGAPCAIMPVGVLGNPWVTTLDGCAMPPLARA